MQRFTIAALALGSLLGASGGAWAGPKKDIEAHMVRAEQFAARDRAKVATQEIGLMRAWLTEARAYFEQEDEDEVGMALARARAAAQCIDATLQRAEAEALAVEAEARAVTAEKRVAEQVAATREVERERQTVEQGGH